MAQQLMRKRAEEIPLFLPKKQKYACSLYYQVYKVCFLKKSTKNVKLNYYKLWH